MRILAVAAVLTFPTCVAAAETPTLWNCLGETRIHCRGTDCMTSDVVGAVQISLLNWTYERCANVCVSGATTRWVETASGDVVAIASDVPQHLILRPGDRFTDIATVGEDTVITQGRCFPALKDQATSLSLLDGYDAQKAVEPPHQPD